MISPLKELTYRITTHFGEIDSFHSVPHTGVDYATPLNTIAQSVSDGIVGKISNDPLLGENIRVTADNGREWVYGHLNQVNVSYGQHVARGDTLGLTGGMPGTVGAGHSSGPHIHIGLLQNGALIDPTSALDPSFMDRAKDLLFNAPVVVTPGERFVNYASSISHSIWSAIVPAIVPLAHSITLIGGVILIVLYIGGYKPGLNKLGILLVGNMLVQIVFQ